MSGKLLRALSQLLPSSEICLLDERPWRSLTFSGKQVEFSATLSTDNHSQVAREFSRMLPGHDFPFGDELVADISVAEMIESLNRTHMIIHALVLDT